MTINRSDATQEVRKIVASKRLYIGRAIGPNGQSLEVRVVNEGRLTPDAEGELLGNLRESFFRAFMLDAFEARVVHLPAVEADEDDDV